MDTVIAIVLTIEIVFIFVGSILAIIVNIKYLKNKLGEKIVLLIEIFVSFLALIAMIAIMVAVIHMHIPLFETDVWPVWTAIIALPLIIIRLVYDYRKEKRKEEGVMNELQTGSVK
ncbi:MAG: hypothetical protein GXO25_00585 [Euryarchaeota archaeon]|nr:hypothetical protein [Euryarchaeota archaeon]